MSDDQNCVIDSTSPDLDVVFLECVKGLMEVLNELLIKQDHEAYSGGAAYIVFAIGGASIRHGRYLVEVPVLGAVLLDVLDVMEKLPLRAPMIAVTVNKSDG